MAISTARRRANDKYDKENMKFLSCKVKNKTAEEFKKLAESQEKTVNAMIKVLILQSLGVETEKELEEKG